MIGLAYFIDLYAHQVGNGQDSEDGGHGFQAESDLAWWIELLDNKLRRGAPE